MRNCIFCDKRTISRGLLNETENFYARANMRGALAPGHIMIISKYHFFCFGEMPASLDKEYLKFIEETKRELIMHFSYPILIEQGVHGQSVNHAHIHLLPSVSEQYDLSNRNFIDFIPLEIKIERAQGILDIGKIFREDGGYISIEENGELYICRTKDYQKSFSVGREIISKITGIRSHLNWLRISQEEQEESDKWIERTIQKLRKK